MVRYEDVVACCADFLESVRSASRFDPRPTAKAVCECVGTQTDLAARALLPYPSNGQVPAHFAHLPWHLTNVAALCVQALHRADAAKAKGPLAEAALVHDVGMVHDDVIGVLTDRRKRDVHRAAIERHPDLGARCLKLARISPAARSMVYCHHRWPEGSGYPQCPIPKNARPGVFLLRLFDGVEAGSHARPHKDTPAGLLPQPWTVFDSDKETHKPGSREWTWSLDAARRCLYGVVCDRVREEQFDPDLNEPFFEKYLPEMLRKHVHSQFPDMQDADIEDSIAEARREFLKLARKQEGQKGCLREQGAVKYLLKKFAREHALKIVDRRSYRPLPPDGPTGAELDPAWVAAVKDDFRKKAARMSLEEMCVYVLMYPRGLTADEALPVVRGLFGCPPDDRPRYLAEHVLSGPETPLDLSDIASPKHLDALQAVPRNRRCTRNTIYKWLESALGKLDDDGPGGSDQENHK